MIRKIFTMSAIALSTLLLAQTEEEKVVTVTTTTTTTTVTTPISSIAKNDVLINPFILLAGSFNASYERHLNQDIAIGVSVLFGKESYLGNEKTWYVLPHYRHYMGSKWANGFFVEGFAGVVGKEYESHSYNDANGNYHTKMEKETNFGLGFGIGGKWQTKRNLIFEVSGGLGRAFGTKQVNAMFGKGMLGVGYRF